jgi:DNA-binding NarL/FixJ family response regulator
MNSQKKILLIDGDHLFGNTIKSALLPDKYSIISAYTCISGIHKAFIYDPDLIFYNTNLDPLEGPEVFKALKLTSNFSQTPIVFYKDKDEVQINNFINNNGDGTFTKTRKQNRLPHLIKDGNELQIENDQAVSYDFNTLFHLSPHGMFIFDKKGILSINQVLLNLVNTRRQDTSDCRMEDIIDKTSLHEIRQWMKAYLKNKAADFNQQVMLKDRAGERVAMNLKIAELKRTENSVHFLGLFQAIEATNPIRNYQMVQKLSELLKNENIEVSEELERKIIQTVNLCTPGETPSKRPFFTKRENEVLQLSMEGLSIKLIADKLSLSTRTIEKYRTTLMLKSGAKNIVEVIVFSIKNNLLTI